MVILTFVSVYPNCWFSKLQYFNGHFLLTLWHWTGTMMTMFRNIRNPIRQLYLLLSPSLIGPRQANLVRIKRIWYASAQSRQNLGCSLIQAVNQEEPSDRKPDPWPLWMAGHAQLKFVMTECSKTQIRFTGLNYPTFLATSILWGTTGVWKIQNIQQEFVLHAFKSDDLLT